MGNAGTGGMKPGGGVDDWPTAPGSMAGKQTPPGWVPPAVDTYNYTTTDAAAPVAGRAWSPPSQPGIRPSTSWTRTPAGPGVESASPNAWTPTTSVPGFVTRNNASWTRTPPPEGVGSATPPAAGGNGGSWTPTPLRPTNWTRTPMPPGVESAAPPPPAPAAPMPWQFMGYSGWRRDTPFGATPGWRNVQGVNGQWNPVMDAIQRGATHDTLVRSGQAWG